MRRLAAVAFLALIPTAPAAAGHALLEWIPPVSNTDGSGLTDLAGYRIAWGCTVSGNYPNERFILQPNLRSFLVDALPDSGTCYFRVFALNAGRVPTVTAPSWTSEQSPPSAEALKVMNATNAPLRPYVRAFGVVPAGAGAPSKLEELAPAKVKLGFAGDPYTITPDATSSPTRHELRATYVQSGELVTATFTTATLEWRPPFAGLWRLETRGCNANGCGAWRDALEDGALFFFRLKPPTGGGIDP